MIVLEAIETVIPANPGLRWLPIEEIDDVQAAAYLEDLDKTCRVPKPKKVAIATTAA